MAPRRGCRFVPYNDWIKKIGTASRANPSRNAASISSSLFGRNQVPDELACSIARACCPGVCTVEFGRGTRITDNRYRNRVSTGRWPRVRDRFGRRFPRRSRDRARRAAFGDSFDCAGGDCEVRLPPDDVAESSPSSPVQQPPVAGAAGHRARECAPQHHVVAESGQPYLGDVREDQFGDPLAELAEDEVGVVDGDGSMWPEQERHCPSRQA